MTSSPNAFGDKYVIRKTISSLCVGWIDCMCACACWIAHRKRWEAPFRFSNRTNFLVCSVFIHQILNANLTILCVSERCFIYEIALEFNYAEKFNLFNFNIRRYFQWRYSECYTLHIENRDCRSTNARAQNFMEHTHNPIIKSIKRIPHFRNARANAAVLVFN